MTGQPRFEIEGRAISSALLYCGIGIALIVIEIFVLFYIWKTDLGYETIIFILVLTNGVALLSFYAAYGAYLPKRVVIDENGVVVYYGDRIKDKVGFSDIIVILSDYMVVPYYFRYQNISINYREKGGTNLLVITEDTLPVKKLKIIFRELSKFANMYKITIVDKNQWLQRPKR